MFSMDQVPGPRVRLLRATMPSNSRPKRGLFWIVLVIVAGFVTAMAAGQANDSGWTRASVLVQTGLGAALVALLLVLWDSDRFWWAGRVLAGLAATAYIAFAVSEIDGLFGLVLLGVPALWYAFTGRFSWRRSDAEIWRTTWAARQAALSDLFGPPDPEVLHSSPPLSQGGSADVLTFRGYVSGVTYVTADLTGMPEGDEVSQTPSSIGNYELMMCTRSPVPWAAPGLAELARYTLNGVVEAGDTMHVGSIAESSLEYVAFATPDLGGKQFAFLGRSYGLLLAVGITDAEFRVAQAEGTDALIARLRDAGVLPYTDPGRASVA